MSAVEVVPGYYIFADPVHVHLYFPKRHKHKGFLQCYVCVVTIFLLVLSMEILMHVTPILRILRVRVPVL